MNTRKMFARVGNECCHCGSVASANTNFQFAYAKATADKLDTGNIGIGNTYTLATLNKMFARGVAGRFFDRINKINRIAGNVSCLNPVKPVNPV